MEARLLAAEFRARRGALAVALVATAAVAWIALAGGPDDYSKRAVGRQLAQDFPPALTSVDRLRAMASKVSYPLYWAGAEPKASLAFVRSPAGSVMIWYLPPGSPPGAASLLSITTIPLVNPLARIRELGLVDGSELQALPAGGMAVRGNGPGAASFAYADENVMVHVVSSQPDRALELVTSGAIHPVAAGTR